MDAAVFFAITGCIVTTASHSPAYKTVRRPYKSAYTTTHRLPPASAPFSRAQPIPVIEPTDRPNDVIADVTDDVTNELRMLRENLRRR